MPEIPVVRVQLVRDGVVEYEAARITNSSQAVALLEARIGRPASEEFWVLALSTRSEPLALSMVARGSLAEMRIHPREVFKFAILANASGVIVAHNHPSGDPTPSPSDHDVTRELRKAGALVGIPVLDHLVLGDGRYLSFRDMGFMEEGV